MTRTVTLEDVKREYAAAVDGQKRKRTKRRFISTRFEYIGGGWKLDLGIYTRNTENNPFASVMARVGARKQKRTKVMRALETWKPPLLVKEVTFIRWAPSDGLDDDGLRSALKSVRDQALCWLQGDNTLKAKAKDGPGCGLVFKYEQHRSEAYGVSVVFR